MCHSDVDEARQEEKDPGNEGAAVPCRSVRSTIPCPSLDDIPYPQRPAVFSGRDPHDRCTVVGPWDLAAGFPVLLANIEKSECAFLGTLPAAYTHDATTAVGSTPDCRGNVIALPCTKENRNCSGL